MSKITYLRGDATAPQVPGNKIIAHVCNDIGGWGRGFVLAVSARWAEPEAAFRRWYRERASNDFALGAVQLVPVSDSLWVANMIGQHGIKRSSSGVPIRYSAIEQCLERLAAHAREREASVHMPRIGCGLAGGTWDRIEPLIVKTLLASSIPVYVYDV